MLTRCQSRIYSSSLSVYVSVFLREEKLKVDGTLEFIKRIVKKESLVNQQVITQKSIKNNFSRQIWPLDGLRNI
ncbi:1423_t:CDS:2 [Acaulospora colombiana]|uniref:1423_t:CDS:1 n=1 Tax=Acaulospora colombiana TaxID=27376 RepID=A0ACA9LGW6_9GLOM|nr:1423_t:CDS:2 [Acaulospora colombiana]